LAPADTKRIGLSRNTLRKWLRKPENAALSDQSGTMVNPGGGVVTLDA
jgi:transposase-like protein